MKTNDHKRRQERAMSLLYIRSGQQRGESKRVRNSKLTKLPVQTENNRFPDSIADRTGNHRPP